MQEYYGIIDSVSVNNPRVSDEPITEGSPEFLTMTDKSVSFVHYPDCQQLSLRIPNFGWGYELFRLYNNTENTIVEEVPMQQKLYGGYAIVYDTVKLSPGNYTFELNWKFGFQHIISFTKHEVKKIPEKKPVVEPVFTYDINDRSRRLLYDGNARAATIIYIDGPTTLRFSSEMGGGNCMFFVLIPTEEQWEKYTNTSLSERDTILQFVAETMQKDKTSGRRFEIDYSQITFFYH